MRKADNVANILQTSYTSQRRLLKCWSCSNHMGGKWMRLEKRPIDPGGKFSKQLLRTWLNFSKENFCEVVNVQTRNEESLSWAATLLGSPSATSAKFWYCYGCCNKPICYYLGYKELLKGENSICLSDFSLLWEEQEKRKEMSGKLLRIIAYHLNHVCPTC